VLVSDGTSWSSGTGSGSFIQNQTAADQTAGFRITGNGLIAGNVGIGTATPSYSLDVKSTGVLLGRFDGTDRSTSSFGAIGVRGPDSNGNVFVGVGGAAVNNTSNNVLNKAFVAADPTLDGLNLRSDNPNGYVQITAGGVAASNEVARFTNSGNVGIGNASPNARLDIRTNPNSTSDPGSGYLGIGTTSIAANSAGAGAIRYSTLSGGGLEFSNGTTWNTLQSNVQKANVYASRTSPLTFDVVNNTSNSLGGFNINSGAGNVLSVWNSSTGVYTAPRTGLYTISAGMSFLVKTTTSPTGIVHFLVMKNGFNGVEACNVAIPVNYPVNQNMSANISCSVPLNQGETLQIKYHQWSGGTVQIALDPSFQGRYYFSVVEN
jgi:hypothetical protein